jgi:hypothetical protein
VKRMGRLNKMITLSVLIIVMKSICDSLVISRQELGQPIFLEGIFGLTHIILLGTFFVMIRRKNRSSCHDVDTAVSVFLDLSTIDELISEN